MPLESYCEPRAVCVTLRLTEYSLGFLLCHGSIFPIFSSYVYVFGSVLRDLELRYLLIFAAGMLLCGSVVAEAAPIVCEYSDKPVSVQFKKPSMFGDVFVVDSESQRHLRFGSACGADQSSISLIAPDKIVMEYVRNASLSLSYARRHNNALIVGMGGGVFSNLLARAVPAMKIDAIEIDPVVVDAAKEFFDVRETQRYKIHTQDAAVYIANTRQHYDIIFLDAYSGEGIPEHLTTKAFFKRIGILLNPGGVVVANFGLSSPRRYLQLAERLRKTMGATKCLHGKEEPNLVVIAAGSQLIANTDPVSRSMKLDSDLQFPFSLTDVAKLIKDCPRI